MLAKFGIAVKRAPRIQDGRISKSKNAVDVTQIITVQVFLTRNLPPGRDDFRLLGPLGEREFEAH